MDIAFKRSIFEQLAHIEWRHSADVIANVREVRIALDANALSEVTWAPNDYGFTAALPNGLDLFGAIDNRAPCKYSLAQIDLLATTAKEAIAANYYWHQTTSLENYLDLFRSAADGKALNTEFQFRSFLNFAGIGISACNLRSIIVSDVRLNVSNSTYGICDGGHSLSTPLNLQYFWSEISDTLKSKRAIGSAFEVFRIVRDTLRSQVRFRTRPLIVHSVAEPILAPSTHEWVHGYVLWTGISPPERVSDADTNVRWLQKSISKENESEYFRRQEDRPGCTRMRRSRNPRRGRNASRSSNRHLACRHGLGRGAFRRSWANCQNARYQAA